MVLIFFTTATRKAFFAAILTNVMAWTAVVAHVTDLVVELAFPAYSGVSESIEKE